MDNALDFYKSCGIKIKTTQTDNAMMFKNTNFISWNEYATWCSRSNIIRRTIPLGEPQCNGCVERFHLTIDKEQHMKLMRCKTQDEVEAVMKEYMNYYNNNRWHYYIELKNLPFVDRHLKPIDAIKFLSCYNESSGQSEMSGY